MSTPLVSFIVPCFNYATYLPDCVTSILGQQVDDFELLLIDDASTDATASVMRSFDDRRIRLLFNERNLGHVGTITRGLQESRGRFVARIDPDDRYRPRFLSATLGKFSDPDVGMVYGDVALIDPVGSVTHERTDRVHHGADFKGNELIALMRSNFICAPSVIARREAWIEALPVPPHLAFNDWYFTLKMARRWQFYYVDEVLADYRVHEMNHHTKVARNGSEERSVLWLLDQLYEQAEPDPLLEAAKRSARRSIYSAHYLDFGNKYFGFGMYGEARRCYLAALGLQPIESCSRPVLRRLLATFLGRRLYAAVKRVMVSSAG